MKRSHPAKRPPNKNKSKPQAGLPARRAALEMIHAVFEEGQSLETNEFVKDLDGRDRALAHAIASITVRRRGQIDKILGQFIKRVPGKRSGNLLNVLRMTTSQLLFMEVASHAAVSVGMEIIKKDPRARHFAKLANGVLRNISRDAQTLKQSTLPQEILPDWLKERWENAYGKSETKKIAQRILDEPYVDIQARSEPEAWAKTLNGDLLCDGTIRISLSGLIPDLPGFQQGDWWVQDFSAKLAASLLGDVSGKSVADICAAPGGKTAYLAAKGGQMTALDQSASRLQRLQENLRRLQLQAEIIEADFLSWQTDKKFDAVLLDAPCSATGTVRKNPDVLWRKQPDQIDALSKIQEQMIKSASKILKPGGYLVFCTCSLEPEEGEALLSFIENSDLPLKLSPIKTEEVFGLTALLKSPGFLRCLPSSSVWKEGEKPNVEPSSANFRDGMTGFFIVRFVKMDPK